jgi:hypothetical protein
MVGWVFVLFCCFPEMRKNGGFFPPKLSKVKATGELSSRHGERQQHLPVSVFDPNLST